MPRVSVSQKINLAQEVLIFLTNQLILLYHPELMQMEMPIFKIFLLIELIMQNDLLMPHFTA